MFRLALLVVVAVPLFGCDTRPPCGPSTCAGCCTSQGDCQAVTTPQACGAQGKLCVACPVGTTCFGGTCLSTSGGSGGGMGSTGGGAGGGNPTGGGAGSTGGGAAGGGTGVDCTQQITRVAGSGGCVLDIVSPADCAELDFDTEGFVTFAWTTNQTFCEGPHRFFLLGHPPSTWFAQPNGNGLELTINSTGGAEHTVGSAGSAYAMTRNIGGTLRLMKADLLASGITTTTGQYHWAVTGFYSVNNGGSTTGSRTFTVKR